MRRTLIIILFGLLLGQAFAWIHFQGYLTHWSRVEPAPVPVTALIRTDEMTVYGQTTDGAIYGCAAWKTPCWFRVMPPLPHASSAITHIKPCAQAGPAFSFTATPPAEIRDCVAGRVIYADGYGDYLFAVRSDQSVWYWHSVHSAYDRPLRIFPIAGALAGGLLCGIVWAIQRSRQTRLHHQTT